MVLVRGPLRMKLGARGDTDSETSHFGFRVSVRLLSSQTTDLNGICCPHSPSQFFGGGVSAGKLKMYHPDFIRYLRNR